MMAVSFHCPSKDLPRDVTQMAIAARAAVRPTAGSYVTGPRRCTFLSSDYPAGDFTNKTCIDSPGISIGNSSPWSKPDIPEPSGLDNNNNEEEEDHGRGGGSEDDTQPQEPESTSTTSTTSSATTTTTTTTSSSSGCTAIPAIAIATDGISFGGTGTSGASASAWASSYPTVTNDPVFGAGVPVAVGGTYTPTSQYSIATNPGTSSSTTATITTSSVKILPTDSAGGQPRYDILYFADDSNLDSVTGPVMQNQGHESHTDESGPCARRLWIGRPIPIRKGCRIV